MSNNETQSFKQTKRIFDEFIRKDKTVKFIKEYRELLGMPVEGFRLTDQDKDDFINFIIPILYLPNKIFPLKGKTQKDIGIKIINTCMAFVKSEGFDSYYMIVMFRMYLIFNKRIDVPTKMFEGHDDFCKIEHLPSILDEYHEKDQFLLECMYGHFKEISKTHPLILYINPNISQNQLKDFISKNWSEITNYREESTSQYSKLRKKRNQKRDDIIYKNRDLPLAEIREILSKECNEYLDDGHIGKIIQIEKERRN